MFTNGFSVKNDEKGLLVGPAFAVYANAANGLDDIAKNIREKPSLTLTSRVGFGAVYFLSRCILVDPASCHMLVSKIKPCMSKYTLWHSETANGSLNQLWFIRSCVLMWITVVILELIHATGPNFTEGRFY